MQRMKKKNLPKPKFIVGIDEVGRGPLAGPVAVCAFRMSADFDVKAFGPIKDSKKLGAEKREAFFRALSLLKKSKKVDYAVVMESAKRIDAIGISRCIKHCLVKALKKIKAKPSECLVLLDGGLKAPLQYKNQKTIVKGDEKERAIAFASIIAKVTRDRLMHRLSKQHSRYDFHIHKGYGTAAHRAAIKKYGLSALHRRSFCSNILSIDK